MSQENINTIRKIYEEFGSKNFATVLKIFSEDFEWIAADSSPLGDQSPYSGLDSIKNTVFARIDAGFERLTIKVDEIFAAGEKVVVLGYYDARLKENGSEFQAQLAHVWTFNGETPVRFQQYVDTLKLFLAMKK